MSHKLFRSVGIAVVLAVGSQGCSNMTPGENAAVFGTLAGVAVGVPLALAGVDPNIVVPVTVGAAALVATGAYIYAKHQANEQQRKIAEARARLYLAKVSRERERQEAASASSSGQRRSSGQVAEKKPAKAAVQTPRYIAVETDQGTDYKGKAAVMIYDTKTQALVGNDVYDLKSSPKAGTVSKYDTVQAQYVGAGT